MAMGSVELQNAHGFLKFKDELFRDQEQVQCDARTFVPKSQKGAVADKSNVTPSLSLTVTMIIDTIYIARHGN
jgi:hypothetical protein